MEELDLETMCQSRAYDHAYAMYTYSGEVSLKVAFPQRWNRVISVGTRKLNRFILGQTNGEKRAPWRLIHRSKINCEGKNGPVIRDSSVVSVFGIGQCAIGLESVSSVSGRASLVREAIYLICRPVPVAIFTLVVNLGEQLLGLSVDSVIGNTTSLAIIPLCDVASISGNPLCQRTNISQ